MMRWLAAVVPIVFLAALPASPPAAAAPFGVRLGLEKIVLVAPPGFSDTTDLGSPRLKDLGDTLTSASNRVLLFAMSDTDVRRFMNGDQIEMKRYMIVATPKGLERERVGADQFATLVADSLRELGKPVAPSDYVKYLDAQPMGKENLFSELKKEAAIVSVLQGVRLPPLPGATIWESSKPQYLFFTRTLFLVRGKALQVSIFTLFDGPADVDWLTRTTQRWVDELQRLNPR